MRAVSGAVISSKPVALAKVSRVISLFAASDASGLPAGAGALVLCAAQAAAELHAFRRGAGEIRARTDPDGEAEAAASGEKRRKKRRRGE